MPWKAHEEHDVIERDERRLEVESYLFELLEEHGHFQQWQDHLQCSLDDLE